MEYLYHFANASLTLRLIEYLNYKREFPLDSLTVIHRLDTWIVKLRMASSFLPQQQGDLKAVLNELGIPYQPLIEVKIALQSLESGESPLKVMHRYQVVIVSHGKPSLEDVETFRQRFIQGLGYCPQHLA